jgi:Cytochrome c554 and c-prime
MARMRKISELLAVVAVVALPSATLGDENNCVSCHQDVAFYAQYPKLYEYYQKWLVSPHEQVGVTCDQCHGGDISATSMDKIHAVVLPMNDERSTLYYQKQPDTCGQCHADKREQFVQSKHYAALIEQRAAPTCTTCHAAMSRRPELRSIILNACSTCHAEGNSEGLPLIVDHAKRLFRKLNIVSGQLGWTRAHYKSHDWPDDSEARVRNFEERHGRILNRVHRFDLQQTEVETDKLLGELRDIFDEVRQANEQQAD